MNIKSLAPVGPYVEGVIRFSYEEGATETSQLPDFELLSRVHESPPEPGQVPRMKTHPIADQLKSRDSKEDGHRLIKEVPIRFLGASPESILSANFSAYQTSTGRLVCSGNGSEAIRKGIGASAGTKQACKGPDFCAFAHQPGVQCKLHCRMRVQVDGSTDPLAVFEFQSSGINTYKTLAAKLNMLHAMFGNLRRLPFRLTSWTKSSALSNYEPFFVANIELRDGKTFATTKVESDDAFGGVDEAFLNALEESMLKMAKDSVLDLEGVESTVTTWTQASVLLGDRGTLAAGESDVPAFDGLVEVLQKARAAAGQGAPEAISTGDEPKAMEQSGESAKIENVSTLSTPIVPTDEMVDETHCLCI